MRNILLTASLLFAATAGCLSGTEPAPIDTAPLGVYAGAERVGVYDPAEHQLSLDESWFRYAPGPGAVAIAQGDKPYVVGTTGASRVNAIDVHAGDSLDVVRFDGKGHTTLGTLDIGELDATAAYPDWQNCTGDQWYWISYGDYAGCWYQEVLERCPGVGCCHASGTGASQCYAW